MNEEIRSLVEYRLKEARDSREEAEILLEKGKTRGALNRVYYAIRRKKGTVLFITRIPQSPQGE